MGVKITETALPGVLVIEPQCFKDTRGFFLETFNKYNYEAQGLKRDFIQDNHSFSQQNVLRGLHYQLTRPQGKLVYAVTGEIYDVAVDIRKGSPTFGQYYGTILSEENHKQLFIPEGFAHGFCVISETANVTYKCTDVYTPGDDYGILWSDPTINIDWPIDKTKALLSEKDAIAPTLNDAPDEQLPTY